MQPKHLQHTRTEYQTFSLEVFTDLVAAEKASVKPTDDATDPAAGEDAELPAWQKLLREDLALESNRNMKAKYLQRTRPEYNALSAVEFRDQMAAEIVKIKAKAAEGPIWEGSEAQKLLRLDLVHRKHKNKSPEKLRGLRKEYQVYSLEVFSKYVAKEREALGNQA